MYLNIPPDVEKLLQKLAGEDNCSPADLIAELIIKEDKYRHLDSYLVEKRGEKKAIRFRCRRPNCFETKTRPHVDIEVLTGC